MNLKKGFTLIELLLASGVGLLVLATITSYLRNSISTVNFSYSSQILLEDLRVSGNYISDIANKAVYIFPPGSTITLNSGGYSTKNPIDSTNKWTIGNTTPMVAMLLPPEDISNKPAIPVCSNASGGITTGCPKFFAFYAVKRSEVMKASGATGAERPNEDSRVPNAWTIYTYQAAIDNFPVANFTTERTRFEGVVKHLKDTGKLINFSISGSNGNLLTDYVGNDRFKVFFNTCFNSPTKPLYNDCFPSDPVRSVSGLEIQLQGQIPLSNSSSPSNFPAVPLSFNISPLNIIPPLVAKNN